MFKRTNLVLEALLMCLRLQDSTRAYTTTSNCMQSVYIICFTWKLMPKQFHFHFHFSYYNLYFTIVPPNTSYTVYFIKNTLYLRSVPTGRQQIK